ncbi:MAG: ATP-binding protein, partial [Chthoniobacteraceae bacterium]
PPPAMQATLPTLKPQPISIRGKVVFGFGLGLAMLVAIAMIAWRSTRHFLTTADKVAHSRAILETEEKVLRHLMEMESVRRGYLLTGDEKLIAGFNNAKTLVNENFSQLQGLIAEDTETLRRAEKIRALLDASYAKQAAEIDARRRGGFAEGQKLFVRADSEQVNREIHAVVQDFEERERMRLNERSDTTKFVGAVTTLVIIVGSSVAFIALVTAGWMILRDIAKRRRAEAALAAQAQLLNEIIDTIPDLIVLKDTDGRIVLDNRAHRRYLGVSPDETLINKTARDIYPREIAERHEADDRYVLSTGAPIRNREEAARPSAPNINWLATTRMPLRDVRGKIIGLVGVSTDITQRKADEEKLQRFAAQLERSNAELQNFASVASHDLQEPLRKIQAFGDRLAAKCADQLGEQGRGYLDRMQNAAQRMQTLIQDLLQLSRVTSRAQPFQPCDLGQIAGEVVGDLEVRIEQTGGKVEIADLPTIDADPLQMRQLFQNLIANALKFHKPGEPPLVRITGEMVWATDHSLSGAKPREPLAEITVEDNGIGFEPKFAEQIFVIFQRLHTKQEYEGTGIGLAVCRKITDRHGGSIVAHSVDGRGATFTIRLPVKQSAEKQYP